MHRISMHWLRHSTAIAGDCRELHHTHITSSHDDTQRLTAPRSEAIQGLDYWTIKFQFQVVAIILLLNISKEIITALLYSLVCRQEHMLPQRVTTVLSQNASYDDVAL